MQNPVKDALLGMSIGSALGYSANANNNEQEAIELTIPYWSNDISLAMCLAEALVDGYDIKNITKLFLDWFENDYWATTEKIPNVSVEEITWIALKKLRNNQEILQQDLENYIITAGSLKRVLPLVFYLADKPMNIRYYIVKEFTELTHPSDLAVMANFYLTEFARNLLMGDSPQLAFATLQETLPLFFKQNGIDDQNIQEFWALLFADLWNIPESELAQTQNVSDVLQFSLWALLNSNSFVDAVIKAVSYTPDSEAAGTITGGLAGLFYGSENIPKNWKEKIAFADKINHLAQSLFEIYNPSMQTTF